MARYARRSSRATRLSRRQVAAVAALMLGSGAASATPASAAIQRGTGTDAVGDSGSGGPSRDIVESSFSYDTNGQVIVSAKMAAPIDPVNADAFVSFNVGTAGVNGTCGGASISIFGFYSGTALVTVSGNTGRGSVAPIIAGRDISFVFSSTTILNRDFTCMRAVVASKETPFTFYDPVEPNVFVAGFGPDRDGDGKADNIDACPDLPGTLPDGCAPPVEPTGTPGPSSGSTPRPSAPPPGTRIPSPNPGSGDSPAGGTGSNGDSDFEDRTGPGVQIAGSGRAVRASTGGVVSFKLGPATETTTGVLSVRTTGKVRTAAGQPRVLNLGAKSYRATKGQTPTVRLRLSKTNRETLRRLGRLRVQVRIVARDAEDNTTTRTYRFVILSKRSST